MADAPRPDPDAALARYRMTGAPGDLGALFDATAADLFRVAAATSPDAAAAEDAVQETFLAVIDAVARWDPSRRAMPWLLGILKFKVAHQRSKPRAAPPLPDDPDGGIEGTGQPGVDREDAARAWAEIEALEDPYRGVALLRWRYGLSPAEIAHVRGEAPGTTRSLLSRALERVRRGLRALPAVFTAGTREPRGLDAVRDAVTTAAADVRRVPVAEPTALGTQLAVMATLLVVVGGGVLALGLRRDAADGADAPATASTSGETGGSAPGESSLLASRPGAGTPTSAGVSAPDPAGVARGRVVDDAGRPIAGAHITAMGRGASAFVVPSGVGGSPTAERVATTDVDGRFEVPVDPADTLHELLVTAAGHGVEVVGPLRAGSDTTIVLGPGAVWSGRVMDGLGAPIPGARVTALVLCSWFRLEREVVSDKEGSFAFEGLPARTAGLRLFRAWFEARAAGFAPTTVAPTWMSPGQPIVGIEIVLRRGSTWRGRVVDGDTARPIAGAEVSLASAELRMGFNTREGEARGSETLHSPFENRQIARTRTDAEGRWTIDAVPSLDGPRPSLASGERDLRPWIGLLEVRAVGYAPRSENPRRIEEGGEETLDLVLWRAGAVTGRIVRADGAPHAGTVGSVTTAQPAAAWRPFVADADGRYTVADLPAPATDSVVATVRLPRVPGSPTVTVRVRPGESVDAPDLVVTAPADDAVLVEVRVVDEAGAGVPFVVLYAGRHESASGITDAQGRATVRISPRRFQRRPEIELRTETEGYAPGSALLVKEGLGEGEVRIVLATGFRITGRVVAADGRPVGGAYVTATPVAPPPPHLPGDDPEDRPPPLGVFTEPDGTFLHADLAAGGWTLSTTAPSRLPRPNSPRVQVGPVRAGANDVVLQLPKDEAGVLVHVAGTAVDADTSAPLSAGFFVRWERDRESVFSATQGGGRFAAEVPAGTWDVEFTAVGYRRQIVRGVVVAEGGPPVKLVLRASRGATMSGVVEGAPPGGDARELWFAGVEHAGGTAPVDADGRFATTGLEPGAYLVYWGYPSRPATGPWRVYAVAGLVEIPASEATLVLRLVPAGGLSVTTEDASLPISGRVDEASAESRARAAASVWVVEDAKGREIFRRSWAMRGRLGGIDGLVLAPGRYGVRLERPGTAPATAAVEIAEGEHVRQTLGGP